MTGFSVGVPKLTGFMARPRFLDCTQPESTRERDARKAARLKRGLCPECGQVMLSRLEGDGAAVWTCARGHFERKYTRGSALYRKAREASLPSTR